MRRAPFSPSMCDVLRVPVSTIWSQVPTFGIHAPPASGLGRLRRSPIVRRRPHVLAVLAASCLIAASIAGPAAAQSKGKALVRLAHFAENVAVGDIYVVFVNGRQKFNDVPYKTVSDYLPLDPGTYKIEVRPARAPSTAPAEAQLSVSVEAGRAYTVGVW